MVVGGAPAGAEATTDPAELAARVARLETEGQPRKAAMAAVAAQAGVPKRVVYDAVLAARG